MEELNLVDAQRAREACDRFSEVANQFCDAIDSVKDVNRVDLAIKIYPLLPLLIAEAIKLPTVGLSERGDETINIKGGMTHGQWEEMYSRLKEELGDWDLYSQVFDPTKDREVIYGSLADDIADIYRDVKGGIVLYQTGLASPDHIVWEWRFSFYSHWGHHAIDALRTIHSRLEPTLS